MSDHYDAKTGQFGRRASDNITREDFNSLRQEIKDDIRDLEKLLDIHVHNSTRAQSQVQESLQRQLDQNNEQHKEIMAFFKAGIADLVTRAEKRLDLHQEEQDRRDESQDKRLGVVELTLAEHSTKIEALENAQAKKVLSKWEEIKGVLFNAMAVGGISLILLLIAILVRWEDFINWIKGL